MFASIAPSILINSSLLSIQDAVDTFCPIYIFKSVFFISLSMTMHFLGRLIKYLLRSLFSIVVFILLVGLAKTHRQIGTYIDFLNTNDWTSLRDTQGTHWTDMLWPTTQQVESISDVLDESLSGDTLYDADLENALMDQPASDGEEDFGFLTGEAVEQPHDTNTSGDAKSELLKLIKQRELTK